MLIYRFAMLMFRPESRSRLGSRRLSFLESILRWPGLTCRKPILDIYGVLNQLIQSLPHWPIRISSVYVVKLFLIKFSNARVYYTQLLVQRTTLPGKRACCPPLSNLGDKVAADWEADYVSTIVYLKITPCADKKMWNALKLCISFPYRFIEGWLATSERDVITDDYHLQELCCAISVAWNNAREHSVRPFLFWMQWSLEFVPDDPSS